MRLTSRAFHFIVLVSPSPLIKVYLRLSDIFLHLANHTALRLNGGIHPKHEIMKYHLFFTQFLGPNDRVLDVGSNLGKLSSELAAVAGEVTGIEIKRELVEQSKVRFKKNNLTFIHSDVFDFKPNQRYTVAVMSNVLEHIDDRIKILKQIKTLAPILMIRVPAIDRDWWPLYRKKIGFEWRSDPTHFTEYTNDSLKSELTESGWKITDFERRWGEIYVRCVIAE